MAITVQVLMTAGCGHGPRTVELVREVLRAVAPQARLETVTVATTAEAERLAFPGSPTVRINGAEASGWADDCTGSRTCPRDRWWRRP